MSGYKRATVSISEQEYRRLHQADMKKRFGEHTKSRAKNQDQDAELINVLQQMESRQRQLEAALCDIHQDASHPDMEALQDILAQNALCYQRLAGAIDATRSSVNDSFVVISQQFAARMQEEREQYHLGLQDLAQRLDAYSYKEQAKEKLARQWLNRSLMLSEFIQDQFDHERFRPGKLSRLLERLNFAQGNLEAGAPDASLQTAQQVFLDLSELHFELEHCILEWQAEFERAQSTLSSLLHEIQLNSAVPAIDLQGETMPEQVDLDFWTNGKYRIAMNRCQQFLTVLAEQQLSADELKCIHTDVIPAITEYFDSVIYEARLNALNSQLRMNIAETALQALEIHGFQLNESGYTNQDMRSSFTLRLENADGSKVSIQVLPIDAKTQELANELLVKTEHPYLKTEQEARLQWDELCRTFRQYNLNVSQPEIQSTPSAALPKQVEDLPEPTRQRMQLKRQNDV